MAPSTTLPIAVNFASQYYSLLVSNPAELAQFYTHHCELARDDKKFRGRQQITQFFNDQAAKSFRVVVTDITEEPSSTKADGTVSFTVQASYVYQNGQPSQQFRHTVELVPQSTAGAKVPEYVIAADTLRTITSSPIASAFGGVFSKKAPPKQPPAQPHQASLHTQPAAPKPRTPEQAAAKDDVVAPPPPRISEAWSADTPPAFAAKPKTTVPPMPMEEEAEATPAPAKVEPAVQPAPSTAPVAPAAQPAKKKQAVAPAKKPEPEPAKPAEEPKQERTPEPVEESKPAEVAEVKPEPAKPSAPLSFADRIRGKGAVAAPAKAEPAQAAAEAPVKAPEPKVDVAPVKEEEPAEKPAESKPEPAVEATETTATEEDKKDDDADSKPKGAPVNAWSRGPLNFNAKTPMAPLAASPSGGNAPAVLPTKAQVEAAKAAEKEKKEAAAREAAAPAAATKRTQGRPGDRQGGLAAAVSHFHIFVRGLPEGTTEEQLIKVLAPHVPVRPGIKIDSKVVRETVRPTNEIVDRVRTFAFICLDLDDLSEVPSHVARLKTLRLTVGDSHLHFDEVHEKPVFSQNPPPTTQPRAATSTKAAVAAPATKAAEPKRDAPKPSARN